MDEIDRNTAPISWRWENGPDMDDLQSIKVKVAPKKRKASKEQPPPILSPSAQTQPPLALVQVLDDLSRELIAHLKQHPKTLYEIDSRTFEELIAEILASQGWKVQLTARSNDGGYDIFALEENPQLGLETSWLVECKRYAPERPVGVDVIRALYGSRAFMRSVPGPGAAMKLLATTSHFTKGVHEMKASTYDLALKDFEGILDWINHYRPNPNGKLYLKDNKLIITGSSGG